MVEMDLLAHIAAPASSHPFRPSRRPLPALLLATLLLLVACAPETGNEPTGQPRNTPAPTAASSRIPSFRHVFIIIMENESAQAVLGNSAAPYINQLAGQSALATTYYAVSHPSLPNYIALTSGSTNGLDGTDCPVGNDCHVAGTNSNIADEIEANDHTWVAYMESMPSPCGVANSGEYLVRHNPFVYYDDIRNGANNRCASHDVPYDHAAFKAALASNQVPDFVWITPNACHDGHNPCGGDPIAHGDTWLSQNVPDILASPAFQQGGVLFITWDEGTDSGACCGLSAGGGQVAMLVISPLARQGFQSTVPYDHYSLLCTIEESWHLGLLGNSDPATQSGTRPMNDIFGQG